MDTHYLVYSGQEITMAALNNPARLNIGIVGSNPTSGVDIPLRCPVRV
jgi:hypothetical protein